LITCAGTIGKTAVVPAGIEDGIINQALLRVRLDSGVIDTSFFRFFIQNIVNTESFEKLKQGTALKNLASVKELKALDFLLPPLAEQRRIAAKIEALQERSRRAREALAEVGLLLEQFRQSVLAAAFCGDLTADWRAAHPNVEPASELLHRIRAERRHRWEQAELAKYEAKSQKPPKNWQDTYEEPEPVDNSDLQELPDGWCWIRVAELASDLPRAIQSGPFGSNLLHSEFQDTGILAIGIDNVHRDGFSLGQQHRISREKYEELKHYTARPLDVLVTVMATVGRCCLVPADLETAIITKHVYRITLEQRLINPHFLVIGFHGAVEVLKQLAKAIRGQTRPGINGEILKSLAIPVPPRQEQDVICEVVHNQIAGVNNISELISETTGALDQLDQSILAKAFSGELVPQDPSDEPASALLARIREQTAQQAETAKGTKKTSKTQRRDAMRKKSSGLSSQHQPLAEVLTTKGKPMSPEQLLTESGYDDDSIEDFYWALREEIAQGHIRENRLTESDVMLEAV